VRRRARPFFEGPLLRFTSVALSHYKWLRPLRGLRKSARRSNISSRAHRKSVMLPHIWCGVCASEGFEFIAEEGILSGGDVALRQRNARDSNKRTARAWQRKRNRYCGTWVRRLSYRGTPYRKNYAESSSTTRAPWANSWRLANLEGKIARFLHKHKE
jgi:hypothetical protein